MDITDIDDEPLINRLICLISGYPLSLLSEQRLHALNKQIEAGKVKNLGGKKPDTVFEQALVTDNDAVVYPLQKGAPIMLATHAILIKALEKPL